MRNINVNNPSMTHYELFLLDKMQKQYSKFGVSI